MHIVTIVQARVGSSRLPGKVLLPLAGKPLLLRLIERLRAVRLPMTVVVATTTGSEDADIRTLCGRYGVPCYSGDALDLLDRHYRAALQYDADVILKIPSDCPLIDPDIIEKVLAYYIDNRTEYDYVSNLHPPTWPDGNDVEVMSLEVLREAWREAGQPHEREHTTPFLWDQPDRYRIGNVIWESGLDYSRTLRWTVDYIEDYRFVNTVYEMLYCNDRPVFGVESILDLLDKHPWVSELNNSLVGINWYRHYPGVLRTISPGSCGNSIHGHVNEHSRRLPSS